MLLIVNHTAMCWLGNDNSAKNIRIMGEFVSTSVSDENIVNHLPCGGYSHIRGPDYPGCSNTGTQPILMRLPRRKRPYKYLVCEAELDWREAIRIHTDRDRQLVVRAGGRNFRKAWFFKTLRSASRKFAVICTERLERNRQIHERVERGLIAMTALAKSGA